jgi:glycosyltransferase involved in cell wall biosynthesis
MTDGQVSIVTRTKDRPLLVGRSIESILGQTHENWLHIIVNDGGNRDILQGVIDKFSSRYSGRLKLIHNAMSLGQGTALNVGMKASDSDYIVTHDDDDSWEPEFLTKSIASLVTQKKMIPNTRGNICHSNTVDEYIDGDHVIEKYRYSFNGWIKTVAITRLAAGNFIPPISFLFERDVFSEIGFFNDKIDFGEDWEFYLRFISKFEIAVLPEHLANYHLRANSTNAYGNTVTVGIKNHSIVSAALRNELIRQDLASGRFGLGYLVALASAGPLPGNLRHKLWGIQKRFAARWGANALVRGVRSFYRKENA